MKNPKNENHAKEKLLQRLNIQDTDHALILKSYHKQKERYKEQLENAENIRIRIRLQNEMIDLDDAFLEYQASLGTFLK